MEILCVGDGHVRPSTDLQATAQVEADLCRAGHLGPSGASVASFPWEPREQQSREFPAVLGQPNKEEQNAEWTDFHRGGKQEMVDLG